MEKIELVNGIQSSILGFGCAPILGAVDGHRAKIAVNCAIDCGINHFDLARSYGYGDAEKFIGDLLKGRRSNFVIASKFGIKANHKAKLLKPLKPLVRWAMKFKNKPKQTSTVHPASQSNAVADRFLDRIPLNGLEMKKSLEASLKMLSTDYLDYFFIHEPLQKVDHVDELKEMAEKLKKEGKIRAFGLAFMQNQRHFHEGYLDGFDILQFNNSPGISGYDDLIATRSGEPNIFFSPINGGRNDLSVNEKLLTLHSDFPKSVILCSMFNEKHLRENVSLF